MTQVIVALDVDTIKREEELLRALKGVIVWYKVGLRLFTAHGKRAVDLVRKSGGKVFLDLKLHDIPQTVAHAVSEAQKLGVDAVSLHLLGGHDMVRAAADVSPRPRLWGVTVLTSMGPKDVQLIHPDARVPALVESLARLGKDAGADATICSPSDVAELRRRLPSLDLKFVTPGIRPRGASLDDQARVTTPGEAAALGIDYVVVGRPITRAPDPRKAALDILAEMQAAAPGALVRPRGARRDA
ncbi:MAG: orotidine-5'-phosphate decarboxylase [Elusimicrobia bacterium]|nr:orotidine-5'-phosphate decarboxylase [Elusimicrobiota bacterium]